MNSLHRIARIGRAATLVWLVALGAALGAPALAGDSGTGASGVVNVNTATADELQLLPGIGEARAQALIQERKRRGGFKSVDDLLEVRGIGEAGLARMRPHVVLSGKTTAQAP
jgi:competence protein ComEA